MESSQVIEKMERETGLEPATSSLGSWHSTTELLPLSQQLKYNKNHRLRARPKSPSLRICDSTAGQLNIDSKEHAHASLGGFVCKRDTTEPSDPSGDLLITKPYVSSPMGDYLSHQRRES